MSSTTATELRTLRCTWHNYSIGADWHGCLLDALSVERGESEGWTVEWHLVRTTALLKEPESWTPWAWGSIFWRVAAVALPTFVALIGVPPLRPQRWTDSFNFQICLFLLSCSCPDLLIKNHMVSLRCLISNCMLFYS